MNDVDPTALVERGTDDFNSLVVVAILGAVMFSPTFAEVGLKLLAVPLITNPEEELATPRGWFE